MFGDLYQEKGVLQLFILDGKIRINSTIYEKILKFCKKQMDKIGVKFLIEDGTSAHTRVFILVMLEKN